MTFKSLLLALMLALLVSPCFADDDDDGGGEVEFKGVIESLPDGGLNGNWEIGGRTVVVGSFTELREKEGALRGWSLRRSGGLGVARWASRSRED